MKLHVELEPPQPVKPKIARITLQISVDEAQLLRIVGGMNHTIARVLCSDPRFSFERTTFGPSDEARVAAMLGRLYHAFDGNEEFECR